MQFHLAWTKTKKKKTNDGEQKKVRDHRQISLLLLTHFRKPMVF